MKVKLYSKIIENKTQIYDPVSGRAQMLSPEERPEELLGEFNAYEETAPNGSKWIIVNTSRKEIRFKAGETTRETRVNIFRIEFI